MRTSIPRRRLLLIDRIVAAARGKRGAPRATLLRSYFIGVGEEDLAARPPLEALALAVRHVALADRRRPGETLIEVLAPQPAPAGKRPVSQVLIVTDDRPFLVDSIGLAFARAGVDGEECVVVAEANSASIDPREVASKVKLRVRAELGLPVAEVVLIKRNTLPKTSSGKVRRREGCFRALASV